MKVMVKNNWLVSAWNIYGLENLLLKKKIFYWKKNN